jgi:hypothetical protein
MRRIGICRCNCLLARTDELVFSSVRSSSLSLVTSLYCLTVLVSGHSSSPLSSKCSRRSCLPRFSKTSISSSSSLALVLASCSSLILCLVSSSNFERCASVSLFLCINGGSPSLSSAPIGESSCLYKLELMCSERFYH